MKRTKPSNGATTIKLTERDITVVDRLREKLSLSTLNRTEVIRVVLHRAAEQQGVKVA